MASPRARSRTRLRASLVAAAVAVATLISLIGSYVRPPDALLGVAFARACAAEAAMMDECHPRLRVDREDTDPGDVDGVAPSSGVSKRTAHARAADDVLGPRLAVSTRPASVPGRVGAAGDRGLAWLPVEPPTRARARLMVFLN